MESFLINKTIGLKPNSLLAKLLPNHYQYSEHSIRIVSRNQINYELDISDFVDFSVYSGLINVGFKKVITFCEKGNNICDIGSNIGFTLLNFAKVVGEKGFVYGFEPDAISYKKCQRNININDFQNISLNNYGLGDKHHNVTLETIENKNRGMNKIINQSRFGNNFQRIKIKTMDHFIKSHIISKIHLIKIDVEGFEFNVLKGATKTIKEMMPIIFIEIDDRLLRFQGTRPKEIIRFLKGFGYSFYDAELRNSIDSHYDFKDCHIDIICIPDSKKNFYL
jgi:FkbM family methyltransferase